MGTPFQVQPNLIHKMKIGSLAIISMATAAEKKVPPRTPEDRINQLKRFMGNLKDDFFSGCKKSDVWVAKMRGLLTERLMLTKKIVPFSTPTLSTEDLSQNLTENDVKLMTSDTLLLMLLGLSTPSLMALKSGLIDTSELVEGRKTGSISQVTL